MPAHGLSVRLIALACLFASLLCVAQEEDRSAFPWFRLILNDDGDFSATDTDPAVSVKNLREMIRSLEGTPVTALAYSVGAGSDILYYPTEVASTWGWRETPMSAQSPWKQRIAHARALLEADIDPIRIVAEEAKAMGLAFVPSYRMNDSHFVRDPLNYPLTGRFWIENQDKTLGASPVEGYDYSNLLDYLKPEVRQHRRDIVLEIMQRYGDIMDGLELDFNRVQILFPAGKASQGALVLNDWMRRVRQDLDRVGRERGRRIALLVRVPPSVRNCTWAGIDIGYWMREGLVDAVIPSQLMTLAHAMPVDEFRALAAPAGSCAVLPSIYPRTNYTWPFSAQPDEQTYAGAADRVASAALMRGAALNYAFLGADGFEMFNVNLPASDIHREAMVALADPQSALARQRVYAVTPAYFMDHEDTYQYRKQIPAVLERDAALELTLLIGEQPSHAVQDDSTTCALRIGFAGKPDPDHRLILAVNGHTLKAGAMGFRFTPVRGRRRGPVATEGYFQITITDPEVLRQGPNRIHLSLRQGKVPVTSLTVTELQLAVLPHQPSSLSGKGCPASTALVAVGRSLVTRVQAAPVSPNLAPPGQARRRPFELRTGSQPFPDGVRFGMGSPTLGIPLGPEPSQVHNLSDTIRLWERRPGGFREKKLARNARFLLVWSIVNTYTNTEACGSSRMFSLKPLQTRRRAP